MVIESKVTETRSIEIEIPYFCKYGKQYIKVLGCANSIKVQVCDFQFGITIMDTEILKGVITMSEPCTEEEFNAAFNQAFEVIQNQKEELV